VTTQRYWLTVIVSVTSLLIVCAVINASNWIGWLDDWKWLHAETALCQINSGKVKTTSTKNINPKAIRNNFTPTTTPATVCFFLTSTEDAYSFSGKGRKTHPSCVYRLLMDSAFVVWKHFRSWSTKAEVLLLAEVGQLCLSYLVIRCMKAFPVLEHKSRSPAFSWGWTTVPIILG